MYCVIEEKKVKQNEASMFFRTTTVDLEVAKKICDMLSTEKEPFVVLESNDCANFKVVYKTNRKKDSEQADNKYDKMKLGELSYKDIDDPIERAEKWIEEIEKLKHTEKLNHNDKRKKDNMKRHHKKYRIKVKNIDDEKKQNKIPVKDNNEKNDRKEIKDKSISNGKVKIEMADNKKVRRRRRKVYISDELRGFLDKGRENLRKTILKKRNEPVKCVISFVLE